MERELVADGYARQDAREYLARHGEDMPEIADWNWDPHMTFGAARSTEADNV